ncbi:MAG: DNA-3-methyladenine glycosylase, partial [Lentimicrobium sp.]|nr:DNA-3-methyladenine glycosylase [Lentimicrobium sp.]
MEHSNGLKFEVKSRERVGELFYLQPDVLGIAKQLIGMKLVSYIDNQRTAGVITETEAYAGETDRASHSFGGRRTRRTETMYGKGGSAYIYLCYGVHSLFNVVTNELGVPHAVLIRGIFPVDGIGIMKQRIGRELDYKKDGSGPGKVTKLLGLDYRMDGTDLLKSELI